MTRQPDSPRGGSAAGLESAEPRGAHCGMWKDTGTCAANAAA
jgi:hypothetical protein